MDLIRTDYILALAARLKAHGYKVVCKVELDYRIILNGHFTIYPLRHAWKDDRTGAGGNSCDLEALVLDRLPRKEMIR